MKKRVGLVSMTAMTLIGVVGFGPNILYYNPVFAEESINTQSGNLSEEKTLYGLMGYYYKDSTHKDLQFVAPSVGNNLKYNQEAVNEITGNTEQKFQYIQWKGRIISDVTGDYTLKSSDDKKTTIKVDGKVVSNGVKKTVIHLEAGKSHKIEIGYKPGMVIDKDDQKLTNFTLFKVTTKNEEVAFKQIELLNPKVNHNESIKATSEYKKGHPKGPQGDDPWGDPDEDLDTDMDNIPDLWEEKVGYTIHRKVAVAWEDGLEEKGYTKFMSNSMEASTAGDPYSDYEKAAKDMPLENDESSYNPMIATYPIINVSLERTILSPNENLSWSVGSSTSQSASTTNTKDVSVNAGISSEQGLNFGVSASYSNSSTSSSEWGTSNEATNSLNTAQAAYLNGNIRYNNTGTGAIYDLKPTLSFVLGEDTLITTKAKDNATAALLKPKASYPEMGQNGIAINTSDDFNSHPITLNNDQTTRFITNKEDLRLETNQIEGLYAIKNQDGQIVVPPNASWTPVKSQIDEVTASIVVDDGINGMQERRIAAKDFSNPEDYTPEIKLRDALKLAFAGIVTEDNNGHLFYNGAPLDEKLIQIITDKNTEDMINKQLKKSSSKLYDIKLERKMNFTFKLAEKSIQFSGDDPLENDSFKVAPNDYPISVTNGVLKYSHILDINLKKALKPNSKYRLSLRTHGSRTTSIYLYDSNNMYLTSTSDDGPNDADMFHRTIIDFETHEHPEQDLATIKLISDSNNPTYLSDVAVTRMGSAETSLTINKKTYKQILFEAFKDSVPKIDNGKLINVKFKNAARILKQNGIDPKLLNINKKITGSSIRVPFIESGDDCFIQAKEGDLGFAKGTSFAAIYANPKVNTDVWATMYIYNDATNYQYGDDFTGPIDWTLD